MGFAPPLVQRGLPPGSSGLVRGGPLGGEAAFPAALSGTRVPRLGREEPPEWSSLHAPPHLLHRVPCRAPSSEATA